MASSAKSNQNFAPSQAAAAVAAAAASAVLPIVEAAQTGIAQAAGLHKLAIEVAAQQTAVAASLAGEGVRLAGLGAAAPLIDVAGQGIRRAFDLEKGLVDLAAQQSAVAFETMKAGLQSPADVAGNCKRVVDAAVDTQRKLLNLVFEPLTGAK